jgi:hypothetical protein
VKSPLPAAIRLLGFSIAAAALGGCLVGQPALQHGDEKSAEILYSGDVASTLPIAKRYCAGYERVARLVDTTPGIAYYACDLR